MSEKNQAAAGILAVMQKVNKVIKTGKNKEQHYKFVAHAHLAGLIRGALIDAGLVMVPVDGTRELVETRNTKGSVVYHGSVGFSWDIIHVESGHSVRIGPVYGEGFDHGDKTIPKANTNAAKYAILLTFMLPSDDDPEADETTDQDGKAEPEPKPEPESEPEPPEPASEEEQTELWTAWCSYRELLGKENEAERTRRQAFHGWIAVTDPKVEKLENMTSEQVAAAVKGLRAEYRKEKKAREASA